MSQVKEWTDFVSLVLDEISQIEDAYSPRKSQMLQQGYSYPAATPTVGAVATSEGSTLAAASRDGSEASEAKEVPVSQGNSPSTSPHTDYRAQHTSHSSHSRAMTFRKVLSIAGIG